MINGDFIKGEERGVFLPIKPALISPNEMSPKSPTATKEAPSDKESCPLQQDNAKRAERPTSLAKRDIIVEISGKEKTKTRTAETKTAEGKHDKLNMCQVHDNMAKGKVQIIQFWLGYSLFISLGKINLSLLLYYQGEFCQLSKG